MTLFSKVWAWIQMVIAWVGTFGSDPDKVAQVGHILAGYAVTLTFALLPFAHSALWGAVGIVRVWGLPKEFFIDIRYEHATAADGLNDWLHYLYGAAAGLLVAFVKFHTV